MIANPQPEHLVPSALVGLQPSGSPESIPHSERVYMLRDPYQLWLEPEVTITRDRTERIFHRMRQAWRRLGGHMKSQPSPPSPSLFTSPIR